MNGDIDRETVPACQFLNTITDRVLKITKIPYFAGLNQI